MIGFIDAVESWLVSQPLWLQVPILMVTLVPICWLVAGVVDRVVGYLLRQLRSGRLAEPGVPGEPDSPTQTNPIGRPADGRPGPAAVHRGEAPQQTSRPAPQQTTRQTPIQPRHSRFRRSRPRRPLPALSRLWMSMGLALLVAVAAGFSIWRSAR